MTADMRDARAAQRHAELWLEKSLAEVDAVHAVLAYERSSAVGADTGAQAGVSLPASPMDILNTREHSTEVPYPHPPSPAYDNGAGNGSIRGGTTETREAIVGPTAQTPTPTSPTAGHLGMAPVLGGGGGSTKGGDDLAVSVEAHATPTSPGSQTIGILRTPELDTTKPVLFSSTRLRSRMRPTGRGIRLGEDEGTAITAARGGGGGRVDSVCSPPTPTILFGEPAADGESVTWGEGASVGDEGPIRDHANGGATSGTVVAHSSASGGGGRNHDSKPRPENMIIVTQNSGKAGEGVDASMLALLRSEKSRREKAEGRVAELEEMAAAAAAVQKIPPASATTDCADTFRSQVQHGANHCRSGNEGIDICPSLRLHECGTNNGGGGGQQAALPGTPANPEQPNSESYTQFAKMDQERQKVQILGLVREARRKMKLAKDVGSGIGANRCFKENGWSMGAAADGCFPVDERYADYRSWRYCSVPGSNVLGFFTRFLSCFGQSWFSRCGNTSLPQASRVLHHASHKHDIGAIILPAMLPTDRITLPPRHLRCCVVRSAWSVLSPASEVASLIQQFEGKLTRSVEDNAELREFCAHLEGLLALHEGSNGRGDCSAAGRGGAGRRVGAPAGGGRRCGMDGAVTGGDLNRRGSPASVCGQSVGVRRNRAPFPAPFEDWC